MPDKSSITVSFPTLLIFRYYLPLMYEWDTLSTPKKDNLDNLGTPSRRRQQNYRGPVHLGLGALNKPLLS